MDKYVIRDTLLTHSTVTHDYSYTAQKFHHRMYSRSVHSSSTFQMQSILTLHHYDPQLLLEYEKTDVDLQEKRDGDTPLHLAVRIEHEEARKWVVRTLLESGEGARVTSFGSTGRPRGCH